MSMPLELSLLVLILSSVLDVLEWIVTLPLEIFRAYRSLIQWAADSVQDLFEDYGYWVVFFGTLSENTLFVGLIVPGAIVVILSGIAAHDGTISIPLSIVFGIGGTLIGDTISYFMGRYGWSRFGHWKMLQELNEKVREPLMRRGTMFVLFYHFAGYTRVIGPTSAGLLQMPYRKWAVADYCGAVLWICTYFSIGYVAGMLGLTLDSTDSWFRYIEWGLLIAFGVWVYYIISKHGNILASGRKTGEEEEGGVPNIP